MFIYPREGEWPSDLINPVRRQGQPAPNLLQKPRTLSDLHSTSPMPQVETNLDENNLRNSVLGKVFDCHAQCKKPEGSFSFFTQSVVLDGELAPDTKVLFQFSPTLTGLCI